MFAAHCTGGRKSCGGPSKAAPPSSQPQFRPPNHHVAAPMRSTFRNDAATSIVLYSGGDSAEAMLSSKTCMAALDARLAALDAASPTSAYNTGLVNAVGPDLCYGVLDDSVAAALDDSVSILMKNDKQARAPPTPARKGALKVSHNAGQESLNTNDPNILNQMITLTEDLKFQIFKLQSEVSEQNTKFDSLQREVSLCRELALAAPADSVKGGMVPGLEEEMSPRRGRKLLQTLRSCISRSPSRSRSVSPKRSLRNVFGSPRKEQQVALKDVEDIHPSLYEPGNSRESSPDKCESPSGKLVAKLAPRLLDNITNFVDAQIQNLELRMASMETSFETYRQITIPECAVSGMSSEDLQMLSGRTVVKLRAGADDLDTLLDPTAELACNPPSSSSMTQTNVKARAKKKAGTVRGRTGKEARKAAEQGANLPNEVPQTKDSSWKRFLGFRRKSASSEA